MEELIAFLNARLDEDERYATAALGLLGIETKWHTVQQLQERGLTRADARFVNRQSSRRALADIAADRAILGMYEGQDGYDLPEGVRDGRDPDEQWADEAVKGALEQVVRIRAARFAGHQGYRQEWAPGA